LAHSARAVTLLAKRPGRFDHRVTSTSNYDMRLRPLVMRLLLVGIVASLVVAGCGGGGGSCGQTIDITGSWTGPVINDSVARGNPGVVNASISPNGCEIGGEWFFNFQSDTLDKFLLIGGNAPKTDNVSFFLDQCLSSVGTECGTLATCQYQVSATLISPSEMTGTYATLSNCSTTQTGSFDIKLQFRFTPVPGFTPTPIPPRP